MSNKCLQKIFFLSTVSLLLSTTHSHFGNGFHPADSTNSNHLVSIIDDKANHNYIGFAAIGRLDSYQYQKFGKYVPITGNLEQMKYFLNALKNSKNQKVRIAHYGDSLIMGDVITESLRNKFQLRFGGYGVGMLSIVADDSRMKRTVIHSSSDDWTYASIVSGNRGQYPLGMNGTVCIPKPGSWVQYEASRVFRNVSSFDVVRLLYSNADHSSTIQYFFDSEKPITVNLESGKEIKQLVLKSKEKTSKIKIKFVTGRLPYIYGVSLESADNGVYIDNYSLRGNSGVSLLDISSNIYEQYDKHVPYGLIILNFGANVSFANRAAYILYENKMEEVIAKLKEAFPKTSFLLIGVGDKTMKKGSQFITNPDIPFLIEIQKRIAEKTEIAYWNLWEVMGGNNSMYSWVNAAPPLAFRDYAHLNSEGGEIVANFLYDALMDLQKK